MRPINNPILPIAPLKMMKDACHFHQGCPSSSTSTMTDWTGKGGYPGYYIVGFLTNELVNSSVISEFCHLLYMIQARTKNMLQETTSVLPVGSQPVCICIFAVSRETEFWLSYVMLVSDLNWPNTLWLHSSILSLLPVLCILYCLAMYIMCIFMCIQEANRRQRRQRIGKWPRARIEPESPV